jgi:chromosome segregation ATPase
MGGGSQAIISRSDQEITQRINSLNALLNRIDEMQKVSSSEKKYLSSAIQSQIADLTNLKTQIGNDSNSTSSLRTDFQSITKSYRIYMLVIPQGTLTAAADRIMTITSTTAALAAKLQTRISEAQTAGQNVSALQSSLSDLNAKVTDANAQAQAALNEITPLMPDNGSSTQMQANTATLKDARSKIATAQKDLIAARKDAGIIVKGLITMDKSSAASGATASETSQ